MRRRVPCLEDMDVHQIAAIGIALLTVAGMIARPWRSPEWVWAVAGALAEVAAGAVAGPAAWSATLGGADVYAFLVGVLMLAEAARSQGVFAWLAGRAEALAGDSRFRLLALVYGAGVLVTATLSNDTAIIVLTPAALALGRRIGSPLPYLFSCAFVANAASFLLPSGNPANLLLYARSLPALGPWLAVYGMAGISATLLTFVLLAWSSRGELAAPIGARDERPRSSRGSRLAVWLLALSAGALILASALALPLGSVALMCGLATTALLWFVDRDVVATVARTTPWGIVPLVAGLLVVVAALERAGATAFARSGLSAAGTLPPWLGRELSGMTTMLVANGANNLPVAVFAGRAFEGSGHALAHAVLVGIDLGPNLSVSGSLATLLWLIALRREGVAMTPLQFFFRGVVVTLPAMLVALLVVR